MKKIEKDFDIFVNKLLSAYQQFCLDEIIHLEVKTNYYRRFKKTWDITLSSLELGYLIELAKIFESQRSDETITIYYFLDYKFKEYYGTIEKLKKLRNKFLAHTDVKTMRDLKKFMDSVKLKRSEIRLLFKKTIEVIDTMKTTFGLTENLVQRFEDEKKSIEEEFKSFVPLKY